MAFSLRGSAFMSDKRVDWLENVMRILPIAGALGIATALIASSGQSQTPDSQLSPASVDLLKKGDSQANVMLSPGDVIIIPESMF